MLSCSQIVGRSHANHLLSSDDIAKRIVRRDPCRRCGVRGDVGCGCG